MSERYYSGSELCRQLDCSSPSSFFLNLIVNLSKGVLLHYPYYLAITRIQ